MIFKNNSRLFIFKTIVLLITLISLAYFLTSAIESKVYNYYKRRIWKTLQNSIMISESNIHDSLDHDRNTTTKTKIDNSVEICQKGNSNINSGELDLWFLEMETKYAKLKKHVKEVCKNTT